MAILDHSDDEEEQGRHATSSSGDGRRPGSRFGARRLKQRPGGSHQHLLLMDCVGGGDGDGASEETVPLPDYERLSQSARLPDDPPADDAAKNPPPASLAVEQQQKAPAAKQGASSPQPPPLLQPTAQQQQQKPAAWRLIEYVRSRHKSGGAGAGGGCSAGSDGDSKSSEDGDDGGEEGKKDKGKKKKRSSWLPDPDRRWPVQGFY